MATITNKPRFNFGHVLRELSVNSKYPCEVLRELISNSYDANATEMRYYPLYQKDLSGFIFFDNGTGMSMDLEDDQDVSPYEAFFSIGHSTKTEGGCIGYKCQGAKLAFACGTLILITKCDGEDNWRTKTIDKPKYKLNQDTDITPEHTDSPWKFLETEIGQSPTVPTKRVLRSLNKDFFQNRFSHGTMVIILDFFKDMASGSAKFNPKEYKTDIQALKHEGSYLWNYIRLYTRHGDARLLNYKETGFSATHKTIVENAVINKSHQPEKYPPKLYVWIDKDIKADKDVDSLLAEVPAGYPYLSKPSKALIGPKDITALKDGAFYCRHAGTFNYNGDTFTWILAIDGNKRALSGFSALDRHGNPRCGLKLSEQRGVRLCAQGVPVCSYNELFEDEVGQYQILKNPQAVPHYTLFLDGPFQLVTDRNDITSADKEVLSSKGFKQKLKSALDGIFHGGEDKRDGSVDHNAVFRSFIQRLIDDIPDHNVDTRINAAEGIKKKLNERGKFTLNSGPLKDMTFVYPKEGEENWVGALYTLLSTHARKGLKTKSQEIKDLWVRPVNMANRGIDAHALPLDQTAIQINDLKGLEYKYHFQYKRPFNHPLMTIHYVVCWEFETPRNSHEYNDKYSWKGDIKLVNEDANPIYFHIENIRQKDELNPVTGHVIKVISLKRLIEASFDCNMS